MPRSRPASDPISFHQPIGQYYVTRGKKRVYLGADREPVIDRYYRLAIRLAAVQQIVEAFSEDQAPRFLIPDRDSIYGDFFRQWIKHMGIEQLLTAYRSPCQSPYVERVIGSIRRECLNHVIVLNERHLRRILSDYCDYYMRSRTHLSLDRNSPIKREVEPPERGSVIAIPQVGGLHHRYCRAAYANLHRSKPRRLRVGTRMWVKSCGYAATWRSWIASATALGI